jgi:endonuclease-3 related protein
MNPRTEIRCYYRALSRAYGPQYWWPARTRFEVIVGAFLTQNTAWSNVKLALRNLRRARVLSVEGVRRIGLAELEQLVRPAGYFRQKALRLKMFVSFLDAEYGGSLRKMFSQPTPQLRERLLSLNGVGPETADAILLYAGEHPVFVVDVYARRILHRHGIMPASAKYEEIRELFEKSLNVAHMREESASAVFNQAHALIVQVGKRHCKKQACCQGCPLERFLPRNASPVAQQLTSKRSHQLYSVDEQ